MYELLLIFVTKQVDDDRLLSQVFTEIRCGRLEKAELLCCQYGQFWRSAIMEGWRLYHDPFYNSNEKETLSSENPREILGNPNRYRNIIYFIFTN